MADPADPYALAAEAATALASAVGVAEHDVAIVLGSGWGPAADRIGTTVGEVPASELPGFPRSTVAGHGGTIRSLDADGRPVLAYFGRVHGYEGNPVSAVVHNVRTAASAGCRSIILTNAAGSLRE
ncbi:MAG: purine-nucleoside phosphorylase, partial [Acidimicrobiales bacterium]